MINLYVIYPASTAINSWLLFSLYSLPQLSPVPGYFEVDLRHHNI